MDLLRFSGMEAPDDKPLVNLMDRVSFHSGDYFFTVIHSTQTNTIFEIWSMEYPWDPERFVEDIENNDQMEFKLSVYCRGPILGMNYTMKESPTGDPYMLLDCEFDREVTFRPTKGVQYQSMDPILDYFRIGEEGTENCREYVIAVDRSVPIIQNLSIPITDHRFITSIRIGKIGTELEDDMLDYVYENYVRQNVQDFQSMTGYDQSHYVQFADCTTSQLILDQITITIITTIIGLDGLCFTTAGMNGLTCLMDQEIFPIGSKNYDHNPNLLLVGPYFYRRSNLLPFIQSLESIETDSSRQWATVQFNTKVIQFFDNAEDFKKSKRPNSKTLLQYTKSKSMQMDFEEDSKSPYEITIYERKLTRVDKYRAENKKMIDPIGYAQITTKDPSILAKQGSSNILMKVCPYILSELKIDHRLEFQIVYREPSKLHLVF